MRGSDLSLTLTPLSLVLEMVISALTCTEGRGQVSEGEGRNKLTKGATGEEIVFAIIQYMHIDSHHSVK